ncbi:MAG TPA: hypothetical protein VMW67_05465 [Desulfobacteria bacterium]|nr:hypothetical protein [Desulfobacteria bacterium]
MTTKHRIPVIVALIALVTYSGGCITDDGSQPSAEQEGLRGTEQVVEGEVLAIAAQEPEVGAFIAENPGYHYEIAALPPANLTELAQTYPVIYGNLPNATLYQIEYTDGRGLLVIVDLENETVVRYFRTTGVSLE